MSAATPEPSDLDAAVFEYGRDDRDDNEMLDPERDMGIEDETVLTDGFSFADDPLGVDEGTTIDDQRAGDTLADRELRSHPDLWQDPDVDPSRADRLVDTDGGALGDTEADLIAREAGGDDDLPAEEAAIHRIDPAPEADVDLADLAVDEGSTNG